MSSHNSVFRENWEATVFGNETPIDFAVSAFVAEIL